MAITPGCRRSPTGNIFISYRRQDAARQARALNRILEERFSEASVFFDVRERLAPGLDFATVLEERISSADIALFVIGPDWNPTTGTGRRRLDDRDDYVRLELATALDSPARIVPVLVGGATMPSPRTLPRPLRRFTRREAVVLPSRGFDASALALTRSLDEARAVTLDVGAEVSASSTGVLRLSIVDAYGRAMNGRAKLVLRSEDSGRVLRAAGVDVSRRLIVRGLSAQPDSRWLVEVEIPRYRPVRWVVRTVPWKEDTTTEIFVPVDPKAVQTPVFPAYAALSPLARQWCDGASVGVSGRSAYQGMPALHKAHLLNCAARVSALPIREDLTLGQLLQSIGAGLVDVRADRLRVRLPNDAATLALSSENSPFVPVPAALHTPSAGYSLVASGKTRDPLLPFQLTLFKGDADHELELEFDETQGLTCVFRVERTGYSGQTDPYDVHELLVRHQRVDPGYTLLKSNQRHVRPAGREGGTAPPHSQRHAGTERKRSRLRPTRRSD